MIARGVPSAPSSGATVSRPSAAASARASRRASPRTGEPTPSATRDRALDLGHDLAELFDQPDAFVAALVDGYAEFADPDYAEGEERIAPGIGPHLGVREPIQKAVLRGLRPRLREATAAQALWLAERLRREPMHEVRRLTLPLLRRSLQDDPERSWQLLRELSRAATCWIDVDELAHAYALGILLEPYRWAELEQLVYSPARWERRLVGATIAALPYEVVPADRPRLAPGSPALQLIGLLAGDADPMVQKALGWALRSWDQVDPAGVARLLDQEAERALELRDGNRAWVVRDASSVLSPEYSGEVRARIRGLRRGPEDTSRAHEASRAFANLIEAGPADAPAAARRE